MPRRTAQFAGLLVVDGEVEEAEVKAPLVVGDPIQSHSLPRERLAYVNHIPLPLDLALGTNNSHLEARWVLNGREFSRIGTIGWLVYLCRRAHSQCLVRPDGVVLDEKVIVGPLLGGEARSDSDLLFECEVESLVTPILLRATGLYAFWDYAELDPPGAETGEATETNRSEWRTVVAADACRQPVNTEGVLEVRPGRFDRGAGSGVEFEMEAAHGVPDGEWHAVGSVVRAEAAFVVRGPDVVGPPGCSERLCVGRRSVTLLSRYDEAAALEDPPSRADNRPVLFGMRCPQDVQEFLRTPARVLEPCGNEGVFQLYRCDIGVTQRCFGAGL